MALTYSASETGQGVNRSAQLPDYNAAYTVMGWATLLSGFTAAASIIFWNLSNGTTTYMDRIDTNTNGANLRLKVAHSGTVTTNSSFTAVAGTAFHWCLRRTSTTLCELIVNGSVVATDTTDIFGTTVPASSLSRATHPATIVNLGANATGGTTYKSTHQAYKSWQAALSDAEIAKEMRSQAPVRTANLLYASAFVNDGTLLTDTSGLGGTAWTKMSAGQSEVGATDILTVVTPSTPTIVSSGNAYTDSIASLSASLTGASSVETATFEHSPDGTTWTDSGETTLATTGTTTRTTTGHTTGLTPGATNYIRALWVPASGQIASGPVFVGGGASPGAGMTTLARKSLAPGRLAWSGARPAWFSTAPNATPDDSNDDATTILVDHLSWMKDEDNTMLGLIVDGGYTSAVGDQRLALELRVSGVTTVKNVSSISTAELVTTSATHGLIVGDMVLFAGTNSTPPLTGPYEVTVVNSTTSFTITGVNVTGAGTAAGTATPQPWKRPLLIVAQATNTWCWDATSVADFQAAMRADETMIQHTALPGTNLNRNISGSGSVTFWIVNPSNTNVRDAMRRSAIRRLITVGANSVTANIRRHALHMDNVDASNGARGSDAAEFTLGGFSTQWSLAQVGMIQNLIATGAIVGGNVTGADASTSAVDGTTRRDLTDQVATELDYFYHEGVFAPPSVSFGSHSTYGTDRASTGDTVGTIGTDYAWTPVNYDRYLAWTDIISGRVSAGAGGFVYDRNPMFVGIGYLYDNNKNDTVSDLQLRYIWGMWMLAVETARNRIFFRSADSSNGGYDRLRKQTTLWNLDTGNPLDTRHDDMSAGAGTAALSGSTSVRRVKYRLFEHGAVVTNCTIETGVPYDLSAVLDPYGVAYGTGTLGKLEVLWIPSSINKLPLKLHGLRAHRVSA